MRKTYHGSCHCGAVRFEAELDLAGETSKCNCSICTKARFWKSVVPAAAPQPVRAGLVDHVRIEQPRDERQERPNENPQHRNPSQRVVGDYS